MGTDWDAEFILEERSLLATHDARTTKQVSLLIVPSALLMFFSDPPGLP